MGTHANSVCPTTTEAVMWKKPFCIIIIGVHGYIVDV